MLMIGRIVRRMIVRQMVRIALMMIAARIVDVAAKLDAACERVGKMHVMLRMLDAVHQRDVGLPGQHDGERHADDGDPASNRLESLKGQQRLALRLPKLPKTLAT